MKLIEFCKDREVLVECEQCKSTFKSPFKLIKLYNFHKDDVYKVEVYYKYCPYCNSSLNCNKKGKDKLND